MKLSHCVIIIITYVSFALVGCVQKATLPAQAAGKPKYPTRLLFLVFDQLRPDLIDRYQMKTFQKFRSEGLSFPNSYVGHLGSLTVVSHAVMTTGFLPKNLPWQDDILKDERGMLGAKGRFYSMVDLKSREYLKLLKGAEAGSLSQSLKQAARPPAVLVPGAPLQPPEPWGPTAAIAQKFYAAHVFGGTATDTIVTLGGKKKDSPLKGWRAPEGIRLPSFVVNPFGGKYFVDSNQSYGSEKTLYPLDGNRYMPAPDAEHVGGDAWVSSLTVDYMKQNKNWRAVYSSFGAVDKFLHMLAEHDEETKEPWAIQTGATLRKTLERADQSLADLLKYLEQENLLNETLIVITADHGGQTNTSFHGIAEPGQATFDFGKGANFESTALPPALKPLQDTGLLDVASFDSMLRFWLTKSDSVSLAKFAKVLKKVPGIAEIYLKQKTGKSVHYTRHFRSSELGGDALEWAKLHHQELIESMAAQGSPEVLGLLLDHHGYALKGEHGGAQREVQSIPVMMLSPVEAQRGLVLDAAVRLVDLNPIILKLMNIPIPIGLDGSSVAVDGLTAR